MNPKRPFHSFLNDIRACTLCEKFLPFGARPVVRANPSCRLLIIGQAPGNLVHQTGIPFNDPSGDRLRNWLYIDRATFYDDSRIAIMPMGFCYPGKNPKGGDNPPRPECASHWHKKLMEQLTAVELTLLVGRYSQLYYLGEKAKKSGTETIMAWSEYLPKFFPLPHPSWRNNAWLRKNPWFEKEVLPCLRERVHEILHNLSG
ncbi:MAG: uracil-DNA glycosylase family protein [Alphaproteobacteria bacterium]|nr:uracil-DNA glycosylase family protein [Alphaproteobacteria bacterium]